MLYMWNNSPLKQSTLHSDKLLFVVDEQWRAGYQSSLIHVNATISKFVTPSGSINTLIVLESLVGNTDAQIN